MKPILYYRPSGIAIHEAILIREMILLSFLLLATNHLHYPYPYHQIGGKY